MNKYKLEYRHIGLAVRSPEKAEKFLTGLGYTKDNCVFDELQNVFVAEFENLNMPCVELVWPIDNKSPLEDILSKSNGMLYHTCYSSMNREESIELIKNDGHKVVEVSPPQKALLFGGKYVSFYYIAGFGLIEILEIA